MKNKKLERVPAGEHHWYCENRYARVPGGEWKCLCDILKEYDFERFKEQPAVFFCPHCHCMTKNVCGKCKEVKE